MREEPLLPLDASSRHAAGRSSSVSDRSIHVRDGPVNIDNSPAAIFPDVSEHQIATEEARAGQLANALCSAAPPFHRDPALPCSRRTRSYEQNCQLTAATL